MGTSNDINDLTNVARGIHAELVADLDSGLPPLQVDEAAPPAERLPSSARRYISEAPEGLTLHLGSFRALAAEQADLDAADEIRAHLEMWAADHEAGQETLREIDSEEDLLQAHARFRRGEDLPHAWYRVGELLDPRAWAVDLDVFVEIWIDRLAWGRITGTTVPVQLGEDVLDVELPADADSADILTLEGAGLFEDEPYEDEPLPPTGDLHLYFVVI